MRLCWSSRNNLILKLYPIIFKIFFKLDYTNQTDGSITEDSDVWLFGGKRVYKNFFSTDQFIDFYTDAVIQSQIGIFQL